MLRGKTPAEEDTSIQICFIYRIFYLVSVVTSDSQTNKEKLISKKQDERESEEPDYDEDKDQLEEEQEEEIGELDKQEETTTNHVF